MRAARRRPEPGAALEKAPRQLAAGARWAKVLNDDRTKQETTLNEADGGVAARRAWRTAMTAWHENGCDGTEGNTAR